MAHSHFVCLLLVCFAVAIRGQLLLPCNNTVRASFEQCDYTSPSLALFTNNTNMASITLDLLKIPAPKHASLTFGLSFQTGGELDMYVGTFKPLQDVLSNEFVEQHHHKKVVNICPDGGFCNYIWGVNDTAWISFCHFNHKDQYFYFAFKPATPDKNVTFTGEVRISHKLQDSPAIVCGSFDDGLSTSTIIIIVVVVFGVTFIGAGAALYMYQKQKRRQYRELSDHN